MESLRAHSLTERLQSLLLNEPEPLHLYSSSDPLADDERMPAELTAAAVLVPLVMHDTGPSLLLTRRTDHLHDHAGQVSFPGGRVEAHDRDAVDTALRETEEEIGIDRQHVLPLGYLPNYRTLTGFSVTPVVGMVQPGFTLALDAFEVAEVFEVPLDDALNPASYQQEQRSYRGIARRFYVLPHPDYYIWGATAGILKGMADRFFD